MPRHSFLEMMFLPDDLVDKTKKLHAAKYDENYRYDNGRITNLSEIARLTQLPLQAAPVKGILKNGNSSYSIPGRSKPGQSTPSQSTSGNGTHSNGISNNGTSSNGTFTKEQDAALLRMKTAEPNKAWKEVAAELEMTTQAVKERWNMIRPDKQQQPAVAENSVKQQTQPSQQANQQKSGQGQKQGEGGDNGKKKDKVPPNRVGTEHLRQILAILSSDEMNIQAADHLTAHELAFIGALMRQEFDKMVKRAVEQFYKATGKQVHPADMVALVTGVDAWRGKK